MVDRLSKIYLISCGLLATALAAPAWLTVTAVGAASLTGLVARHQSKRGVLCPV